MKEKTNEAKEYYPDNYWEKAVIKTQPVFEVALEFEFKGKKYPWIVWLN